MVKNSLTLGQSIFGQNLKTNFLCVLHYSPSVTALSGPERAAVLTASIVLMFQMVRSGDFRGVTKQFNVTSQPVKAETSLPGCAGEGNRRHGSYREVLVQQGIYTSFVQNPPNGFTYLGTFV